jgi:hypothetical protein
VAKILQPVHPSVIAGAIDTGSVIYHANDSIAQKINESLRGIY